MKHVTSRLAAWLGGELDPAAARRVEEHLAGCADCRASAEAMRAVWDALPAAGRAAPAASVWPAVQSRTTRREPGGWLWGGTRLRRAGLATLALACGVAVAAFAPLGDPATAEEEDAAGFWLAGATWSESGEPALEDLWLAEVADEEDGS